MKKPLRRRHWNRANTKRRWKQPDLTTRMMRDGNRLDRDAFHAHPEMWGIQKTWGLFNRFGRTPWQPQHELPF